MIASRHRTLKAFNDDQILGDMKKRLEVISTASYWDDFFLLAYCK